MSLTGKNLVQYSNSCCKAKGLTWVWVVKLSGISSSSGEVQVRQQVAPGPHCSATEIPALEAMAMTSLKPKLPKGLQHMVGGRTPEELLSAQLYQLGVFDQKNNTCNWKPAQLLNNYTSINNLSVSGKMVLWIIINCGVDLVQLTNDNGHSEALAICLWRAAAIPNFFLTVTMIGGVHSATPTECKQAQCPHSGGFSDGIPGTTIVPPSWKHFCRFPLHLFKAMSH